MGRGNDRRRRIAVAVGIAITLLAAGCSRDQGAQREASGDRGPAAGAGGAGGAGAGGGGSADAGGAGTAGGAGDAGPRARDPAGKTVSPPAEMAVFVEAGGNLGVAAVEKQIAVPLEDALARVPAVDHMRSVSTARGVQVTCTLSPGADPAQAAAAIHAAVAGAARGFPAGVAPPLLYRRPVARRLRFVVASPSWSRDQMASVRDRILVPAFERMSGVTRVATCGAGTAAVLIEIDLDRLRALQLDLGAVRSGLGRAASGGFRTLEDLANAPLASAAGAPALRDVAQVTRGSSEPTCSADGAERGLLAIDVGLADGAGTDQAATRIAGEAVAVAAQLPADVTLSRFGEGAAATLELALETPAGTEPERLREIGARLAKAIAAAPGVASVLVESGDPTGPELIGSPGIRAHVALQQASAARAAITAAALPGAAVHVMSGPLADARITLLGDDLDLLERAARDVAGAVGKAPGVAAAGAASLGPAPRVQIAADRTALARLGLTPAAVDEAVAAALDGVRVGQLMEGGEAIPIHLRVGGQDRGSPADRLSRMNMRSRAGALVPLSSVAQITLIAEPARILRIDRRRAVEIWFRLAAGAPVVQVMAGARRAVDSSPPPAGIEIAWR